MSSDGVPDDLLRPFVDDPAHAGVLTDFDGTLAPIVLDPASARPLPGALDALTKLSARYERVAVISGRPVAFLVEHVGPAGGRLVLSGLYGLEEARCAEDGQWVIREHADARPWKPAVDRAVERAEQEAPPGLRVEHKGLAVTLHWRGAPDVAPWAEEFARETAAELGLVVHAAKASAELRPPVQRDKGSVVSELSAGLAAVCFCGDDVGDLPAFAAVHAAAPVGLAVVAGSNEMAPELAEIADVVVDGPAGVLGFFHQLLR